MSKLQNSQLTNVSTYNMYLRQMLGLAKNVFKFENLPDFIDISFMNSRLLKDGSIAFFREEIFDSVICLPYNSIAPVDIYGRPRRIEVYAQNGYHRILNDGEFIIMYDNFSRYPIYIDILQMAERIALYERISDVNIAQQRTPRIWQTSTDMENTVKKLLNNIDGLTESVVAYRNLQIDKINAVLQPAPYVADKITEKKEKMWNEFLRLIGVANVTVQKKERNIKDEIMASQGGTIASRYQRFEARKDAIEKINKKWNLNIVVSYYDNLPTNLKDTEDEIQDDTEANQNTNESEVV